MIIVGVWQATYHGIAVVAVLTSIITLAYLLRIQRALFFGEQAQEYAAVHESGVGTVASSALLALLAIALGLYAPWLFETFLVPVPSFL